VRFYFEFCHDRLTSANPASAMRARSLFRKASPRLGHAGRDSELPQGRSSTVNQVRMTLSSASLPWRQVARVGGLHERRGGLNDGAALVKTEDILPQGAAMAIPNQRTVTVLYRVCLCARLLALS
jgi:hypothetical protein